MSWYFERWPTFKLKTNRMAKMVVLFTAILESFNKFCSTNNSPQEKNIAILDWHVSNFVGQINFKIVFKNERRMIIGYFFLLMTNNYRKY
jgi:hypothetical protein